ncbi:hypothetical protein G6F56_008617 [Rhizopus delemar]|nr:hypothetical protein G6F56_008617 [Rhizopus delemar]
MTDSYEQQRTYTEEEVLQLFQRFRYEEKLTQQQLREDRPLPVDITFFLEDILSQQVQDNFKRLKRNRKKYHDKQWVTGEEINKSLSPKLKSFNVDTAQVVNSIYKGSEILCTQGRATELFEQLVVHQEGDMSQNEAAQLLSNCCIYDQYNRISSRMILKDCILRISKS